MLHSWKDVDARKKYVLHALWQEFKQRTKKIENTNWIVENHT